MINCRWGGWTLLSNCLAIALAAVVLLASVNMYRHYQRSAAIEKIEQDLKQIWQMGMDYYATTGCIWNTSDGESHFAGEAEPSWQQIQDAVDGTVSVAAGRDPWVSSYQLKVERKEEVADDEVHAHYHLVVQAKMQGLSEQQLESLAARLGAIVVDEKELLLQWDRLAENAGDRYQPLYASSPVNIQVMTEGGESQPSQQYCY